jgi:hypothetical protein
MGAASCSLWKPYAEREGEWWILGQEMGDLWLLPLPVVAGKARSVMGYELTENHQQRGIFCSVLQKMTSIMKGFRFSHHEVKDMLQDINQVFCTFFSLPVPYGNSLYR